MNHFWVAIQDKLTELLKPRIYQSKVAL